MRSPRAWKSTAARRLRPIRRWISAERPDGRPCTTSRVERVEVARGSIAYSAVTQPRPAPARKPGTRFSTEAATRTRVSPTSISAEPSAYFMTPVEMSTGRSASGARSSARRGGSEESVTAAV